MEFDVYGIGNALVDQVAFVDDDFLIRNDILKGTMALVGEPASQSSHAGGPLDYEKCSGGSAANTIVGLSQMGGRAAYTGKVAADGNGEFYRSDLKDAGVEFSSQPGDGHTGVCVSYVTPDGQRSMLTYLGVSSDLARSDINEDIIKSARYLYVEGYQWSAEKARDASEFAMELAQRHGTKVAFTYSDPVMAQTYGTDFRRVTKDLVDLLFCNEIEAMSITGTDTIEDAIDIIKPDVGMVCVTAGSRGALVAGEEVITETPALRVDKLVDTTGAGDMYAAGVLRGLTLGFDLVTASMIGSRMAAIVVSQVGARLR